MSEREKSNPERDTRRVHSEFADPSRPGGYEGVRHPMSSNAVAPSADIPPDADLEASVREKLAAEPRLAGNNIHVAVKSGIVTLSGQIRLEFHHELATACVQAVPGVRLVNNSLAVAEIGPMAQREDGS